MRWLGAVFFNRQGELRDRTFENQRYRASGLNLVVLAIICAPRYPSRRLQQMGPHDLAKIAPLVEIDVLVTDSGLPESGRKAIRRFCATLPKSGRIHR